jgi:hypothetical protein
VWFSGTEQEALGVGAKLGDGGHGRVHAQRHEVRVEVVEPAGKQVGVDRGKLEAAVAKVHGAVERRLVLEPLRPEPALDLGPLVEHHALELLQRSGE